MANRPGSQIIDEGMLYEALDLVGYRNIFKEKGFVRIENVLKPAYADKMEAALKTGVSWDLCYLTDSGPISIPQSEYRAYSPTQASELNSAILTKAQNGFAYFYYRSDLIGCENETLSAFYRELSSDRCLGMFRYITGETRINAVNDQVACFTPACFLKRHKDTTDKEKRFAAYVFNFTRRWDPDWGGHLHILDGDLKNVDVIEPSFNSLTLFMVPRIHFVSQVTNFARGARYTATGWFLG